MSAILNIFRKNVKLTVVALILSIFTLIAYHIPFFRYVAENIEHGANGVLFLSPLFS